MGLFTYSFLGELTESQVWSSIIIVITPAYLKPKCAIQAHWSS
jgi:hypothetical protein